MYVSWFPVELHKNELSSLSSRGGCADDVVTFATVFHVWIISPESAKKEQLVVAGGWWLVARRHVLRAPKLFNTFSFPLSIKKKTASTCPCFVRPQFQKSKNENITS
jgi:hypothetical protein